MANIPAIDIYNNNWILIKEYLEEKLEYLRKKNDSDLSETDTARIRGQIALAKELLALEDKILASLKGP